MDQTPTKLPGIEFLENSIEATPVPQASSTIHKISSDNSFLDFGDKGFDIKSNFNSKNNRKLSSASETSEASSLGLLPADTVQDASSLNNSQLLLLHEDSRFAMKNGKDSLKLETDVMNDFQERMKQFQLKNDLRMPSELKSRVSSETVSSVSSYLLQRPEVPSWIYKSVDDGQGPSKNESNFTFSEINPDCSAQNKNDKILKTSFDEKEISGRSTALSDLTKQHVHEDLINFPSGRFTMDMSNMKILMQQFGDEDFLSGKEVEAMMNNAEAEFNEDHDDEDLSVAAHSFSTLKNDSHITIGSNFGSEFRDEQKLSVSDFFSRKNQNIGNLFPETSESSETFDDKMSLEYHEKSLQDFDLVDIPTRDTAPVVTRSSSRFQSPNDINKSTFEELVDEPTFTCSKISNLLDHMRNSASPNTLADRLLMATKKKPLAKNNLNNNTFKFSSSEIKHAHHSANDGVTALHKSRTGINEKNLFTSESQIISQKDINMSTRSVRRNVSNLRSNSSNKKSSEISVPSSKNECGDETSTDNYVINNTGDSSGCLSDKSVSSTGQANDSKFVQFDSIYEWLNQLDNTSVTRTIDIEDSEYDPVVSLSSSDINNTEYGHWLQVKPENIEYILPTSVMSPVHLTFCNVSGQWLKCTISFKSVARKNPHLSKEESVLAQVVMPQGETLLDPNNPKEFEIWISPNISGRLIITLNISLTSTVSNNTLLLDYDIIVCGDKPKLSVNINGFKNIDFGSVPEGCVTTFPIQLKNCGEANLSIMLMLEQNGMSRFSLSDARNPECSEVDQLSLCLIGGEDAQSAEILVKFHAENTEPGICIQRDIHARVIIKFDKPNDKYTLKQILLHAQVVNHNLKFLTSDPLIISYDNSTQEIRRTVKIRNESNIPLEIVVFFKVDDMKLKDMHVSPNLTTIRCGEELPLCLRIKPEHFGQDPFTCKLCVQVLPSGRVYHTTLQVMILPQTPSSTHAFLSSASTSNSSGSQDVSRVSTESVGSSVSSASTVKLKIETTHRVLSWGTVMLHREERKTIRLKNYADHSYKIRLTVKCPDGVFKILNDRNEIVSQYVLKFYPMECQAINVVFIPNKTAPATGRIEFEQLSPVVSKASQKILLYGYGGHVKLVIKNVSRDSTEKMWLSLGNADAPKTSLQKQIVIENRGTLAAFCSFTSTFKGPQISSESGLHVVPSHVVIEPKSSRNIMVRYTVCYQDVAVFANTGKQVIEIASLMMVSGDEPSRQRLRRIISKEESRCFSETLTRLCQNFENEEEIFDIFKFQDPVESQDTLCQNLTRQEIMLTLENSSDKTLPEMKSCVDGDFASGFSSMLQDTVFVAARHDDTIASDLPAHSDFAVGARYSVSPPMLVFSAMTDVQQTLEIQNMTNSDQIFEVASDCRLLVTPSDGIIYKHETVTLVVTCQWWPNPDEASWSSNIVIYLENDSISVKVIIKSVEGKPVNNQTLKRIRDRQAQTKKYENMTRALNVNSTITTPLRMVHTTSKSSLSKVDIQPVPSAILSDSVNSSITELIGKQKHPNTVRFHSKMHHQK